jgi:glycosyltransferase involved in cell wall biosynthesis
MVGGGGYDLPRLREKARALGVEQSVIFTDLIPEEEKAEHYRLADVFAMPGTDHTFDRYPLRFVFLEALACGLPVVGSRPEEHVDGQGRVPIIMVDAEDRRSIVEGIRKALQQPKRIPPELEAFGFDAFTRRLHGILDVAMTRDSFRSANHVQPAVQR